MQSLNIPQIQSLSYAELARQWHLAFKHPPPIKCGAEMMRQALAWQLQADLLGGLSKAEITQIRKSLAPSASSRVSLAVGTRLLRVWQGETHQVTVLTSGFEYAGRPWASLTAIARAITGSAWSGPLFFGLKSS